MATATRPQLMLASVTMCNDDIRNYNSKISDLGYLTVLLLHSFAVQLIGSCDTVLSVLVVLESMLATSISPTSTTLMTKF